MKYLILLLLLSGCQIQVPSKVKQDVSGHVVTENVIKLEIAIPDTLLQAFQNNCKQQCRSNTDPMKCELDCTALQQTQYANTLMGLLLQYQATTQPNPTPTPTP